MVIIDIVREWHEAIVNTELNFERCKVEKWKLSYLLQENNQTQRMELIHHLGLKMLIEI